MKEDGRVVEFEVNDNVLVLYKETEYHAKILKVEDLRVFLHYHGWSKSRDAWSDNANVLRKLDRSEVSTQRATKGSTTVIERPGRNKTRVQQFK